MLLLSILYQPVRGLLGLTVVLARRDLSKDAEFLVLGHENTVVRRQVARVGAVALRAVRAAESLESRLVRSPWPARRRPPGAVGLLFPRLPVRSDRGGCFEEGVSGGDDSCAAELFAPAHGSQSGF